MRCPLFQRWGHNAVIVMESPFYFGFFLFMKAIQGLIVEGGGSGGAGAYG